jgi:hypothetical protein
MFHERLCLLNVSWTFALAHLVGLFTSLPIIANHIAYALHCVLADANHMMGQANYLRKRIGIVRRFE